MGWSGSLWDAGSAMTTAPTDAPYAPTYQYRRATRDTEAPIIGGVAAGLARHLGLPVLWVRVGFVVATALSGLGVALYAGWWLLLPADTAFETDTPGAESASRGGRRPGVRRRLGDVGPLIVLADARPRRDPAGAGDAGPGRGLLVDRDRRRGRGPAVAAGRRGPARALADDGADEPGPAGLRERRLGVVRPGLRRRRPGRRGPVHHRLRRRVAPGGPAGAPRRRPRRGGPAVRRRARGSSGSPPTSARSGPSGSAPRSAPTWPRTCTTRCSRRWP